MALKYALHTIHHTVDGKTLVQAPGGVFNVADEHVAELSKREAIREPTDDELSLYNLANPPEPPKAPAKTPAPVEKKPEGGAGDVLG